MHRGRALMPLAVAASLAVASPAIAAKPSPVAKASGGDAPPVIPSLIQTRITRTENALERLNRYVDNQNSAKVVSVSKVIRRQTAAAWRGAKYYLRTAPPPPTDDAANAAKKRSLKGDAVLPVIADQFTTAVAVFGTVHDVVANAVELTDGAHGNTLTGLSGTLFWSLDKRDKMVKDAESFEPPAPPAEDRAARSLKAATSAKGDRSFKDEPEGGTFAPLMPEVTQGLDDELQHISGLQSDATDLSVNGNSILKQAKSQIVLTELEINTFWPPVPADD